MEEQKRKTTALLEFLLAENKGFEKVFGALTPRDSMRSGLNSSRRLYEKQKEAAEASARRFEVLEEVVGEEGPSVIVEEEVRKHSN